MKWSDEARLLQEGGAMKLVSREYKAMLNHEGFVDRPTAFRSLREELSGLA
jgi:hypothetical protein